MSLIFLKRLVRTKGCTSLSTDTWSERGRPSPGLRYTMGRLTVNESHGVTRRIRSGRISLLIIQLATRTRQRRPKSASRRGNSIG